MRDAQVVEIALQIVPLEGTQFPALDRHVLDRLVNDPDRVLRSTSRGHVNLPE